MNNSPAGNEPLRRQERLLTTLEHLLAIGGSQVKPALDQASDLIAAALSAEKVEVFLIDPASQTLVAAGISKTPLAQRQIALGLDRQVLANGGRATEVFVSGEPYLSGRVDEDSHELLRVRRSLGFVPARWRRLRLPASGAACSASCGNMTG